MSREVVVRWRWRFTFKSVREFIHMLFCSWWQFDGRGGIWNTRRVAIDMQQQCDDRMPPEGDDVGTYYARTDTDNFLSMTIIYSSLLSVLMTTADRRTDDGVEWNVYGRILKYLYCPSHLWFRKRECHDDAASSCVDSWRQSCTYSNGDVYSAICRRFTLCRKAVHCFVGWLSIL